MRKFLFRFFVFTAIGLGISVITGGCIDLLLAGTVRSKERVQDVFRCETLVVGASHAQTAVLPDSFPALVNICSSSEVLYYTYNILSTLQEKYGIIPENVILDAPVASLSSKMDILMREDRMYAKYFSAIPGDELKVLREWNWSFTGYWLTDRLHILTFDKLRQFSDIFIAGKSEPASILPYCGAFYSSDKSNLDLKIIEKDIRSHYGEHPVKSDIQCQYLDKIVRLCRKNKIHLFLLNAPLHKEYFDRIPKEYLDSYYAVIREYAPGEMVHFLDYAHYALPDSCFGDGNHLNLNGAKMLAHQIKKDMELCRRENGGRAGSGI